MAAPGHRAWQHMRSRCNNPNDQNWTDYGGRGIKVCERWSRFDNFIQDMGGRPTPLHTIERRENGKNYEPGNCYWATRKEQANNRRPKGPNKNSATRIAGVNWKKLDNRFEVTLYRGGKQNYLGSTKDFFEACCLRKSAETNLKSEKGT